MSLWKKNKEDLINRITIDIDDRNISHIIKSLKTLRRYGFTKKLSVIPSPSLTGFHLVAWAQKGVTKKKLIKIRRCAGDDQIRCDLDERSGRQINVLFTTKKKTKLSDSRNKNPFENFSYDVFSTIANREHKKLKKEDIALHDLMICFINKWFMSSKKRKENHEFCKTASKLNKPMYAIIRQDIDWSEFKEYPWRKTYQCNNIGEAHKAMKEIIEDADYIQKAGGT